MSISITRATLPPVSTNTLPAQGTVLESPYGQLPGDSYGGDAGWNAFDRTVTMAGFKVKHRFTDSLEFFQ